MKIRGGKPDGYGLERHHKPRVLISHGANDQLVSPSEAGTLARWAETWELEAALHDIPVVCATLLLGSSMTEEYAERWDIARR